jgi:propionyl-CoA carboxylase alpha chain
MLAKVIAWAPTREAALRRLATALAAARISGVGTNRDLLVRLLRSPEMLAGTTDTGLLDRADLDELARPLVLDASVAGAPIDAVALSALAAALATSAGGAGAVPRGWRNVASQPQRSSYRWRDGERVVDVGWRWTRRGITADGFDALTAPAISAHEVVLEVGGVRHRFAISSAPAGDEEHVDVISTFGPVPLTVVPRFPDPSASVPPGSLLAPMPGTVSRVAVAAGDEVAKGDLVLVLEAMKMEHPVYAPTDGTVESLPVSAGQQVDGGSVLAVLTADVLTADVLTTGQE